MMGRQTILETTAGLALTENPGSMGIVTQAEIAESKRAMARERARDRRQRARHPKLVWNPQTAGRKMAQFIKNDVVLISSLWPVDKHGRAVPTGTAPLQAVHLRKQLLLSWLDAMATIYDRIVHPAGFKVRGDYALASWVLPFTSACYVTEHEGHVFVGAPGGTCPSAPPSDHGALVIETST